MKYSLFAFLVLCFSLSFAQLSVQNDAYVFVTDQVLFVADNVNIDDANSKIYLRDEAQLVQGAGTTGNSGVGKVSVYQTGTSNTYAYNYWCSPIGYVVESDNSAPLDNNLNNNFKPNANIFESTDIITSTIANYTTSYNGTATPFQISQRWIYSFNAGNLGTANDYPEWDFVSQNGTVLPAHGFTMKGNPSGNQLYDFRGKPNNGEMTAIILEGEQTLVGNPYPSALDALLFIHDAQNSGLTTIPDGGTPAGMSGVLYYWEQAPGATSHYLNQYVGGYATYTISTLASGAVPSFISAPFTTYNGDGTENTVGNTGVDGIKTAYRYIPIGQGFMVEGASGSGTSTVHFKNSHRAYYKQSGADSYFFRNNSNSTVSDNSTINETQYDENGNNIVPEDFKRFRINVDFNYNNGEYTRQLLMNFHHTATDGFDYGLEGKSSSEEINSDAHWVLDGEPYTIQAFNFEESLKIPLIVNIEGQQPLRFRIFDVQNFDESQGIYIHDIEADTYVNLRNQNYELNIEAGNYTDRFEIVFTTNVLDVVEFEANTLAVNQNNGIHQLSVLNPKSIDITSIEVYDLAGKRLLQRNYDTIINRYDLNTTNLSDGVYVVSIKSNASVIKSQKIIVKN
jgi:hypothetical protein